MEWLAILKRFENIDVKSNIYQIVCQNIIIFLAHIPLAQKQKKKNYKNPIISVKYPAGIRVVTGIFSFRATLYKRRTRVYVAAIDRRPRPRDIRTRFSRRRRFSTASAVLSTHASTRVFAC